MSTMKWTEVDQHWKQFEHMIQHRWEALTLDDLKKINGDKEKLTKKLQTLYGHTKKQSNESINDFLATFEGISQGKMSINH